MNIDAKILIKFISKLNSVAIELVIMSKNCKLDLTLEISKYNNHINRLKKIKTL